jgi:hypothetical protein
LPVWEVREGLYRQLNSLVRIVFVIESTRKSASDYFFQPIFLLISFANSPTVLLHTTGIGTPRERRILLQAPVPLRAMTVQLVGQDYSFFVIFGTRLYGVIHSADIRRNDTNILNIKNHDITSAN